MTTVAPGTRDQAEFLDTLFESGLLLASGVPGVYGCGTVFDQVLTALDRWVERAGEPEHPEQLRFPPLLPRQHLEANHYLASFPHLAGTVFAFTGGDAEATEQAERADRGEDWSEFQTITDLVLTPAACYPTYPAMAARGRLPSDGATLDLGAAWVFRREASGDPARLQSFRMREFVRLGEAETVLAWRNTWRDGAIRLFESLGLAAQVKVASDPFFGRSGRMLAAIERQQALKFEALIQIASPEPTAVASFNYHQDHFAQPYAIRTADGAVAHTACIGFGMERITLALMRTHGLDPAYWPKPVRQELWP